MPRLSQANRAQRVRFRLRAAPLRDPVVLTRNPNRQECNVGRLIDACNMYYHFYSGGPLGWRFVQGPLSFESQDWEVT